MNLSDDVCPDIGTCPGCGARLCLECCDDVREVGDGYMCGDCVAAGDAA